MKKRVLWSSVYGRMTFHVLKFGIRAGFCWGDYVGTRGAYALISLLSKKLQFQIFITSLWMTVFESVKILSVFLVWGFKRSYTLSLSFCCWLLVVDGIFNFTLSSFVYYKTNPYKTTLQKYQSYDWELNIIDMPPLRTKINLKLSVYISMWSQINPLSINESYLHRQCPSTQ